MQYTVARVPNISDSVRGPYLIGIVHDVARQDNKLVDFLLKVEEACDVVRIRARRVELLRLEILQRRLEHLLLVAEPSQK